MRRPKIGHRVMRGLRSLYPVMQNKLYEGYFDDNAREKADVELALKYIEDLCVWWDTQVTQGASASRARRKLRGETLKEKRDAFEKEEKAIKEEGQRRVSKAGPVRRPDGNPTTKRRTRT